MPTPRIPKPKPVRGPVEIEIEKLQTELLEIWKKLGRSSALPATIRKLKEMILAALKKLNEINFEGEK